MTNPGLSLVCSAALLAVPALLTSTAMAQDPAQRAAEREIARREAALPRGVEALARAKLAMQAGDYALAFEEYRIAVAYLPDGAASGSARREAVDGFGASGVKIAEIRVQEGKYAEAEAICREILSDQVNPK